MLCKKQIMEKQECFVRSRSWKNRSVCKVVSYVKELG